MRRILSALHLATVVLLLLLHSNCAVHSDAALGQAQASPEVIAERPWRHWNETRGFKLPNASSPDYLAMCLIVKDQQADILEWLEHYLNLGVGKIYLFDHGSQPPILPAFAPLVEAGFVEYHWLTNNMMRPVFKGALRATDHQLSPQAWVYHECLRRFGQLHRWMAFFDTDEFLLLKNSSMESLPAFLRAYEAYGGLTVQWMVFGSSGHITRPTVNSTTLAAYTQCYRSKYIKVIANTQYALETSGDPHIFRFGDDKFAVNEVFHRMERSVTKQFHADTIVLNHYRVKSLEEFIVKMRRGGGHSGAMIRDMAYFNTTNAQATNTCTDATALMAGRSYLSRNISTPGLLPSAHRLDGNAVLGHDIHKPMRTLARSAFEQGS